MKLKIGFIGLFPRDIRTMARFYEEVLGLELKAGNAEGPYAEFENEGVRFAMFKRELLPGLIGQTPGFTEGLNGTFELAIPVGAKENVDAIYATLTAGGATPVYAPRDEPWKMRSAMVADPEGNLIEIASDFWQ
ncbi:MAG TPA: VOC family protein [Opitutales bacterium]|nr:VOC family protein [Opitutales bacterium]